MGISLGIAYGQVVDKHVTCELSTSYPQTYPQVCFDLSTGSNGLIFQADRDHVIRLRSIR